MAACFSLSFPFLRRFFFFSRAPLKEQRFSRSRAGVPGVTVVQNFWKFLGVKPAGPYVAGGKRGPPRLALAAPRGFRTTVTPGGGRIPGQEIRPPPRGSSGAGASAPLGPLRGGGADFM